MKSDMLKKIKLFPKSVIAAACTYILSQPASAVTFTGPGHSLDDPVTSDDFLGTITNLKSLAIVIVGICAICSIIMFIVSITKLSASAGNEMMRKKALVGILMSGLALALFGGGTVVIGMFWNMLG